MGCPCPFVEIRQKRGKRSADDQELLFVLPANTNFASVRWKAKLRRNCRLTRIAVPQLAGRNACEFRGDAWVKMARKSCTFSRVCKVRFRQPPATLFGSAYAHRNPATGGPASLYRLDPRSGAGTLIGPIGFSNVGALAVHPITRILYGVGLDATGDQVLIAINKATGAGTRIGSLGFAKSATTGAVPDIAFNPCPPFQLFADVNSPSPPFGLDLFTINIATGLATRVNGGQISPLFPGGNGMSFGCGPTGLALFVQGLVSPTPLVFRVDTTTGNGTVVGAVNFLNFPNPDNTLRINAMDFSRCARTIFASVVQGTGTVDAQWSLATFDPISLNCVRIGPTVTGLDGVGVDFA